MDCNSKHDTAYSTVWSLINCQKRIVEGMIDYTKENINEAHSRQRTWRPQLMSWAAWRVHSSWLPKPPAGRISTACQSHPIKSLLDAPFSFAATTEVICVFAGSYGYHRKSQYGKWAVIVKSHCDFIILDLAVLPASRAGVSGHGEGGTAFPVGRASVPQAACSTWTSQGGNCCKQDTAQPVSCWQRLCHLLRKEERFSPAFRCQFKGNSSACNSVKLSGDGCPCEPSGQRWT